MIVCFYVAGRKLMMSLPILKVYVVSIQTQTKPSSMIYVLYQIHAWLKLTTIRGRFSLGGASRSMLPRTYARCTLFPSIRVIFSHWVFVTWQGFNEATIKRVQHYIIDWWTSKGECCKYIIICGCPCKYSLVKSLWCKLYLYIKEANEIQ